MLRRRALMLAVALLGIAPVTGGEVFVQPEERRIVPSVVPSRRMEALYNSRKARLGAMAEPDHVTTASDLPTLRIVDRKFALQPGPMPYAKAAVRVKVAGDPAGFILRHQSITPTSPYTSLERTDLELFDSDSFWSTSFTARQSYIMIHGYGGVRSEVFNVQVSQRAGKVTVWVYPMVNGAQGKATLTATVNDLEELRTRYPLAMRRYVAPLVKSLCGRDLLRPGAADIYRAFSGIEPTDDDLRRVASALHLIDSRDPAERARGSAELAALGRPGVLAAMRLESSHLSPEIQSRIAHFLADHTHFDSSAQDLLSDKPFLIDCLEDEDRAVREAASAALAEVLGTGIEYDADASPANRAAAADHLRRGIQPSPQTQPAQPSPALNIRR